MKIEWLNNINETDLKDLVFLLTIYDKIDDLEIVANFHYWEGRVFHVEAGGKDEETTQREYREEKQSRPPKKYWEQMKKEIYLLICTDDKKYEELRKNLNAQKDKGTKILIGLISAAVAKHFGLTAGVLTPFCTIALFSVIKLGKETYCSLKKEEYSDDNM